MSPRIEASKTVERKGIPFVYFTMDLNDPAEFSPEEFDNLALQINNDEEGDSSLMKFIVIDDKMYIFSVDFFHDPALELLNNSGINGKVQCAGRISVGFNKKDGAEDNYRSIFDWSSSLEVKNLLTQEESEEYKNQKIANQGLPFVVKP